MLLMEGHLMGFHPLEACPARDQCSGGRDIRILVLKCCYIASVHSVDGQASQVVKLAQRGCVKINSRGAHEANYEYLKLRQRTEGGDIGIRDAI